MQAFIESDSMENLHAEKHEYYRSWSTVKGYIVSEKYRANTEIIGNARIAKRNQNIGIPNFIRVSRISFFACDFFRVGARISREICDFDARNRGNRAPK